MLGPVSDDREVEFRLTVPDEPHGGALKVESSGEGGTTFSTRLPRNAANGSDG